MTASKPTILIDGDVGRLAQGSGLSTYARTLALVLKSIGMTVNHLYGAAAPRRGDEIIDSVSVSDFQPRLEGLRRRAATLNHMFQGVISQVEVARKLSSHPVPSDLRNLHDYGTNYLSPNLFQNSHYRHMLTGSFKEVQIRDRIDVLHLTSPLPVRMSKTPTITTIHDIIPLRLPHSTTDKKSEVLGRLRKTIAYSDVLITVSNHSKSDIVDVLDVDPDKIVVTYQPPNMGPLTPAEVENLPARLFKYGLTAGQFLLFAGAIEPKKNLRRLIEAYLEIDTHYPLVIAGPRAWLWEKEVGDLGSIYCEAALRRLKFLGYVSWEDLRALYGGASVFVFPSLYEGYGLPALDALNMGVPTVVSNSASLPEVCGEAALYADPYDRDDLAHQIKRALNDEELRKTLRLSGPQQAARRSFESYATMVSEAYKRVC